MNNRRISNRPVFFEKGSTLVLVLVTVGLLQFILEVVLATLKITMPINTWNLAHLCQILALDFVSPVLSVIVTLFFNFFSEKFKFLPYILVLGFVNLIGWSIWIAPNYRFAPHSWVILFPIIETVVQCVGAFVAYRLSEFFISKGVLNLIKAR